MRLAARFLIAVQASLLALGPGLASASVTTSTSTVKDGTESFVDVFPGCSGALYDITLTGVNGVEHVTENSNGTFHFTGTHTGNFSATPHFDPSLPSFTGHFEDWDGFNGNTQSSVESFVINITGSGSDGSSLKDHQIGHVTVGPSGVPVSDFFKGRCS